MLGQFGTVTVFYSLFCLPVEGREEEKKSENQLKEHDDYNGVLSSPPWRRNGVVTSSLWRRMEVEHDHIGKVTKYLSSQQSTEGFKKT